MSSPPAQTGRPPMKDFLATVLPRLADTRDIRGKLPPNLFCSPQILLCSEKLKSVAPKNVSCLPKPQNLAAGPVLPKLCSAIRIFCFEGHLAPRCSITSKYFFINHH